MLGLAGFLVHLAIFVTPSATTLTDQVSRWAGRPRLLLLSYMVWLITLAWQAISLRTQHV